MTVPISAGSTNTFVFNPSAANVTLNAFGMIQIRRTDLDTSHLTDAAFQLNLLMVEITNRNPNQFTQLKQTQVLTAGNASYTLAAKTVLLAQATIQTTDSSGTITERVLGPISSSDYFSYPQKATQGPPTSIWFALGNPPTVTLYPTPDASTAYTLNMLTYTQVQDVDLTNAYSLGAPYRFLDCITTGLAARLAQFYRPEQADKLEALYEKRFGFAAMTDQEAVPIAISPGLSSYYR